MSETKPSNPKDLIGVTKLPLHLWPAVATAWGSLALLEGMLKYGKSNYRAVGVRSSVYVDALLRHIYEYVEGNNVDKDSGLHPLGHALACIAIILDAEEHGKLEDDRLYSEDTEAHRNMVAELTPHVLRLKAKHGDKNPIHYTIQGGQRTHAETEPVPGGESLTASGEWRVVNATGDLDEACGCPFCTAVAAGPAPGSPAGAAEAG